MTEYISLGGTCAVVYHIRKHHKRSTKSEPSALVCNNAARYPFDWAKTSIKQLIQVLEEDFVDFDELEIKKFSENHPLVDEHNEDDADIDGTQNFLDKTSNQKPATRISPNIGTGDGSLILTNKYGVTFAHEIIKKDQVETFTERLQERISAFRHLIYEDSRSITFIRLETGRLKKDYKDDVERLIELLSKYATKFKVILIVHKDSLHHLGSCTERHPQAIPISFEEFDSDWKYEGIDWPFSSENTTL